MHAAVRWWPRSGLATVRAEIVCVLRLTHASIIGSLSSTPTASHEILLTPQHNLLGGRGREVCLSLRAQRYKFVA
jgi:hypothetical protein